MPAQRLLVPDLGVALETLSQPRPRPPREERLRPRRDPVQLVERDHEGDAQRLGQQEGEQAAEEGAAPEQQQGETLGVEGRAQVQSYLREKEVYISTWKELEFRVCTCLLVMFSTSQLSTSGLKVRMLY